MEVKNLYPFVLLIVLVGMLIGVGVLMFDRFGAQAYTDYTILNDSFTANNNTEALARTNLGYGNLTVVTAVYNNSNHSTVITSCFPTMYQTRNYQNLSIGSLVFVHNLSTLCHGISNGSTIFAAYTFRNYESAAKVASDNMRTEVGNISSNWLGLVITVVILSIILFLVVRNFAARQ